MAMRSSWIDSWRRAMLGPNYAQWCNHHRVPESPDPLSILTTSDFWPDSRIEGGATRGYVPTASSSEIRDLQPAGVEKEAPSSSKTMANFKNLSYYDQLREIERHLVKLQDSYRRISSVPQSIEPIEGVLESPHTESTSFPSELSKMDSQSANSAGPRVLDAPIEAHWISGAAEMSCIQGNQFGLFREKDPSMSRELLSSSFLLQKPNSSCQEAIEDSVPKAGEDRQILYVSSMEDSSDFYKIDATIDTSTQAIVPSKVAQVGDGLFLGAHNLLEEMPMGDGSAKLQEMGDFEPLKVTSLPLLEEIDGASSKVVSASLTGFVVEPHFVLLYDDGLPIIENKEYQYVCPDIDVEWEKIFDGIQSSMCEVMIGSIIPIKVRVSDRWASSMEFLVNINAHKVFVEKSRPSVHQLEPSEINLDEESQSVIDMVVDKHRLWNGNLIFDPGIAYLSSAIGSLSVLVLGSFREETSIDVLLSKDRRNWVFDPGGIWLLLSSDIGRQLQQLSLLHQLSANFQLVKLLALLLDTLGYFVLLWLGQIKAPCCTLGFTGGIC